jgi:RNA polymerase sigma-70 factor, ECF subfamily
MMLTELADCLVRAATSPNQIGAGGVLPDSSAMHDAASLGKLGSFVTAEAGLDQEFEERLRECSTLAVRVAYSVLRHRQDAEDLAQEAFARAYTRFAQLRDRDRFRAWLVRMTWRLAIDRRRSDRRRLIRETAVAPESVQQTAEDDAIAQERAGQLWTAIDALPEKLRVTIVLAAVEGYDTREVARLLGLPEGTVKSRLFLARKRLAESLQCLTNDISHP